MKNLYYITLLFIAFLSNCSAQTINTLTKTEFLDIKVNQTKFNQIIDTKGSITAMKALFGNDLTIRTTSEPSLGVELRNTTKGFYFRFEDGSDTGNNYSLVNFKILNNSSNVTIKGKTITIGSDINILGSFRISYNKKIIYGTTYSNDTVTIEFNPSTNKITKIHYMSF